MEYFSRRSPGGKERSRAFAEDSRGEEELFDTSNYTTEFEELEFVPPPDDFQLGEEGRPSTVHSSNKQRQERDTNTKNMTKSGEFYGDFA